MRNPYKVSIGEIPEKYIENINADLNLEKLTEMSNFFYVLTGPSGSGKTVTMTKISKELKAKKEWIVINLNPRASLMEDLISKLYDSEDYLTEFVHADVKISQFGVGTEIKTNGPATSLETSLERMLSVIKSKNKKILVCIDEVEWSEELGIFVHTFQIMIRQEFPINLLMAVLPESIEGIRNQRGLSFMYRMPVISMNSLNTTLIATDYMNSLNIKYAEAMRLATVTKGFPTAYQALGLIAWRDKKSVADDSMLNELDKILYDSSYKEILDSLSDADIDFLKLLFSKSISKDYTDYSKYAHKMLTKGILCDSKSGELEINLPRFKDIFSKALIDHTLW